MTWPADFPKGALLNVWPLPHTHSEVSRLPCKQPLLSPGLQPLLHLGNGADIGRDLLGDGGQVGVLLLQLEEVMELGCGGQCQSVGSRWPQALLRLHTIYTSIPTTSATDSLIREHRETWGGIPLTDS